MTDWTDKQTGRTVRQLTSHPGGAVINKFKRPKHVPGGWIMARAGAPDPCLLLLNPETRETKGLRFPVGRILRLRESDGLLWYLAPGGKELWRIQLPDGQPERVGECALPEDCGWLDILCDGRTLIFTRNDDKAPGHSEPSEGDPGKFWHYFSRPRRGGIWACDVASGRLTRLLETEGFCPIHVDASHTDPTLLKFCRDSFDAISQRIWTVRSDGSGLRKIRPQERGEDVMHEFWWPGGKAIGYKYLDRRSDPTLEDRPWGELSPRALHLGIADLEGREIYLSDPLDGYHSHLFVSHDQKWVCGEGSLDRQFVYAARFSMGETKVDFVPMATVHTPCTLYVANHVNTTFSMDSRWLVYNDTVDGKLQVCAVKVEA